MRLIMVHGWGFAPAIWDAVVARLPGVGCERVDLGYFAPPRPAMPGPPAIAVTHSFGTMALLRDLPANCLGLVAINGFDRFAAATDRPGVPPRVLDRMIARFDEQPAAVLAEFRHRCGADGGFPAPDIPRLRADLLALRDGDCRAALAAARLPVLAIDGGRDSLLSGEMRGAQFGSARTIERVEIADGGHLLPVTDPAACARRIEAFAAEMA